jgi:hypothetical protein
MAQVWSVTVGVALRRPPVIDEYRHTQVWAETGTEAELIACQVAACTCVMPVFSIVEI